MDGCNPIAACPHIYLFLIFLKENFLNFLVTGVFITVDDGSIEMQRSSVIGRGRSVVSRRQQSARVETCLTGLEGSRLECF